MTTADDKLPPGTYRATVVSISERGLPTKVKVAWEDLPLKNGEEDGSWQNAVARYGHQGCPGVRYEDVCTAPWDCAGKGRCRILYERN